MKKILFISKNLDTGGMEKALVLLLNKLAQKYDITLILEEKKGMFLNDLDSKIHIEEYLLAQNKNVFIRRLKNLIHKTLWKMKNKNKYDFACNYATYSLIGSYLARSATSNNALYVHSNYYAAFNQNEETFKNFFDSLNVQKFKNIIFVSNEAKKSFDKIYPDLKDNTSVINNLIDYEFIQKKAHEKIKLPYQKNKINFLFIGRLDNDSKNFKRMFKSFQLAVQKNKNINLYIIGDGKDQKLCQELLLNYHLQDNVFMLGAVKDPYEYLNNCDAFILTSNYEGFPVVLTEALVLDVPIISTITASDSQINLEKYVVKIPFKEKEIAKILANFKKKKVQYNINFAQINRERLEQLTKIIEK